MDASGLWLFGATLLVGFAFGIRPAHLRGTVGMACKAHGVAELSLVSAPPVDTRSGIEVVAAISRDFTSHLWGGARGSYLDDHLDGRHPNGADLSEVAVCLAEEVACR